MKKYLISLILFIYSITGYSQTYLGETTILPGVAGAIDRIAFPFVAPATGTLDEVCFHYNNIGLGPRKVLVAVYDNSPTFTPSTKLGVTDTITTTAENKWLCAPLLTPTTTININDTIWLAIVSNFGLNLAYTTGVSSTGLRRRKASSNSTFTYGMPDLFGTSTTSSNIASIYAHYAVSGANYTPLTGRDVWAKDEGVKLKTSIEGKYVYFKKKTPPPIIPVYELVDPFNIGINATIGVEDYDGVCPTGSGRIFDTDCAQNDFTYAPLRKLKSSTDYATIVYIDPTYVGTESGSIGQPYNSWSDFTITANRAYLQKRGTTFTQSATIDVTVNNVLIGAYGTGARPILETTSDINTFYITGDNCTFRELNPQNHFSPANTTNAHSPFQCSNAINLDIYDNEISFGHMGIRVGGSSTGMRVIKNIIHDMYVDGMYFINQNYTEIAWNTIHHINTSYFDNSDMSYSSGDGIQFAGGDSFWKEAWIHHNNIDRSDEANKADIMFTNTTAGGNEKIIIEYNRLKAPNTDASGAQTINASGPYLKNIFNNEFTTGDWNTVGLYGGSAGDSVIGNVFNDYREAYEGGNGVVIAHNTFYNNDTAIYRGTGTIAKFYNNLFYNNRNEIVGIAVTDSADNYNQDPDFEDVLTNDFRLKTGSPMIDIGTTLTYGNFDINGTVRPTGAGRDIGAYEHTTALEDTTKTNIIFAENFNDLPVGAITKNTIVNRWQAILPNFRENNQSIISKTPSDNALHSKYDIGDCSTNQGIEIGIMLDTVYRELYMDVNVCYSTGYDTEHTANHTYGGKSPNGGFWGGNHWNVAGTQTPWITDTIGDLHGWSAHNGMGSMAPSRVYAYIYEIRTWNKQYDFGYTNGGQCHVYTRRVKVNDPGQKNAIVATYKDGVLVQQIDTLWFQSVTQLNQNLQFIEGGVIKHSINSCSDELIYTNIDDIVIYEKKSTNPEYLSGSDVLGHTITPLSGTITTNIYPSPIMFNETRTTSSGTLKSHYTGASFHPSRLDGTTYTKVVNNANGVKFIKFTKWHDGTYNDDAATGMWVKVYSGTTATGTPLYTFDEDIYNGIPTLNHEYSVPTTFTLEFHPSNDLDLGFSLDYYLQ